MTRADVHAPRARGRTGATTLLAALIVTVAACFNSGLYPTPTPLATPSPTTGLTTEPGRTPPSGCVNPPPDLLALINQADPIACYGSAALTIDAHLRGPGAIDCPGGLQPAWFSCEAMIELEPPRTAEGPFVLAARTTGPSMFAVVDPASGLRRGDLIEADWRITGHYDDPAALACHYTAWPLGAGAPPPAAEVVDGCRRTFVVTAAAPLGT